MCLYVHITFVCGHKTLHIIQKKVYCHPLNVSSQHIKHFKYTLCSTCSLWEPLNDEYDGLAELFEEPDSGSDSGLEYEGENGPDNYCSSKSDQSSGRTCPEHYGSLPYPGSEDDLGPKAGSVENKGKVTVQEEEVSDDDMSFVYVPDVDSEPNAAQATLPRELYEDSHSVYAYNSGDKFEYDSSNESSRSSETKLSGYYSSFHYPESKADSSSASNGSKEGGDTVNQEEEQSYDGYNILHHYASDPDPGSVDTTSITSKPNLLRHFGF